MISLSTAAMRYEKLGSECGWHKISWAFLRPVGAGGFLNTDKQVRLQLYKPCKTKGTVNDSCEAFTWWKRRLLKYYPSTLYVTVKGIIPPEKLTPTLRSHLALQPEFSSSNNHLTINFHDQVQTSTGNQGIKEKIQWSRLPVQSCKVPNRCALSLGPTPPGGCMSLSFSHLGTYLACGMLCSLTIYSIPNGSQYMSLSGHQGFIYDLSWSVNDKFLLSVSADNSAYVWNVGQGVKNPFQVLTHPSFVYCGQFHISRSTIFVTGSYDQILRVFSRASKTSEYQLIQELEAHKGFITSVCFKDSTTIVSADSVGGIVIWSRVKVRKHFHHWEYERKLDIREIHDVIVNCICVHPAGRRLLVHTRDSLLRMIDLRSGSAIQWFRGAINNRYHSKASISPCGNLVFCGSEDGAVHVWHSDTGDKVATYTNLKFSSTENSVVSMVTYHPLDHMIAFASYDSYSNILVCDFKKNASCSNLGLKLSIQAHKCINISGLDNENDSDIFNKSLTTLMSLKSLHRVSHSLQGTGILNRDFHESNSNLESPAVSGTIKQNVVNSAYKEDGGKHFVEPFQQ